MADHRPPVTVLCPLAKLAVGSSRGFSASVDNHYADIFVVRTVDGVYGYRNCCPHALAPLESLPDQFLDIFASSIQCAIHGALFNVSDGRCWQGPCQGHSLESFPVSIQGDNIVAHQPIPPRRG